MLPVVVPIQFEKIEGIEENLVVIATGMQPVEIGLPILASPYRFPVNNAGLHPKGQKGFPNPGILAGPVITPPVNGRTRSPIRRAIEPIAVMFDFMDPFPALGRLLGRRRQAGG
jgi:hypothetical protein